MKTRSGFVSNSSSSSFTCVVCGHEAGGMDVSLRDCDMCECPDGHTMCIKHMTEDDLDVRDVKSESCPVCTLKEVSDYLVLQYIVATNNISLSGVRKEIQERFKTLKDVKKFIVETDK